MRHYQLCQSTMSPSCHQEIIVTSLLMCSYLCEMELSRYRVLLLLPYHVAIFKFGNEQTTRMKQETINFAVRINYLNIFAFYGIAKVCSSVTLRKLIIHFYTVFWAKSRRAKYLQIIPIRLKWFNGIITEKNELSKWTWVW